MRPQLELSLSIHCSVIAKDQREFVFRIQNVCDVIPGVGHLPSFFRAHPKPKKMLMPRGWPGGGGGGERACAQLELTDA